MLFFYFFIQKKKTDEKKEFVIVSLTTSPRRIKLIENVIQSILNQTYPPDLIRINIPKIFGRTGQVFDEIPTFLLNHPKIQIFQYDKDYGPIMKFMPTFYDFKDKENVNIIYTDDDVLMLPKTIEVFMKNIKKNDDRIYCFSGFILRILNNQFEWRPDRNDKSGYVDIVEGYMSVCLSNNIIKKLAYSNLQLLDYYNFVSENKFCFTSDDLLLSNFYSLNDIKKYKIHDEDVNIFLWWNSGCELSYGKDGDGIQHLYKDEHFSSYKKSMEFLFFKKVFSFLYL